MCHEVVLLLTGQAHVGDKKLPLSGASCEPSAFSWSPWGVAPGHCALVISDVPVYCLLNALDRSEQFYFSVSLPSPGDWGRGVPVGCRSPACTHPPPTVWAA